MLHYQIDLKEQQSNLKKRNARLKKIENMKVLALVDEYLLFFDNLNLQIGDELDKTKLKIYKNRYHNNVMYAENGQCFLKEFY